MYAGLLINGVFNHKNYNDCYFTAFLPIENHTYGRPVFIDLDSGDHKKISEVIFDWCFHSPLLFNLSSLCNNQRGGITLQSIVVSEEKLYQDDKFIGGKAVIFEPNYNRIPLQGQIIVNNVHVNYEYFSSENERITDFIELYNDTLNDDIDFLPLESLIELMSQKNLLEAFAPYLSSTKPSIQKLDTLNALGTIITDMGFQKEDSFEWDNDTYHSNISSDDLLEIYNRLSEKGFSSI